MLLQVENGVLKPNAKFTGVASDDASLRDPKFVMSDVQGHRISQVFPVKRETKNDANG